VYTTPYGNESFVVREHSGNGPQDEMNERAIACFDAAMTDVGWATTSRSAPVCDYVAWATPVVNRFERSAEDVPDGLEIQRWSWNGLIAPDEP
jgi:hemoglobin